MTLPFVQLPVFLIVIETIRKMAGREEGLAGMFWARMGGLFSSSESEAASPVIEEVVKTVQIESSFATEGALWFPDLLVQDPQMVLPFALSAAIFLNIYGRLPSATTLAVESKWQKRFKRTLGTLALAIGPLTIHVPSAMLVYWISSSLLAYLQAVALELWSPLRKPEGPLKPKWPLVDAMSPKKKDASSLKKEVSQEA